MALYGGRFSGRRLAVALAVGVVVAGVGLAAWSRWSTGRLLHHAEEALAEREYAVARDYLRRYLAARPGDAAARLLAARCGRCLRAYYDAHEQLRRCRKDGGDPEAIGVEEALIEVQRGDEGPVAGLRRRAEQEDELALVILEGLIQFDLDTYQLRQALADLNRYLDRRPDDLQALLGRGYVWERFLYFSDALKDYRLAVAGHPESERARLRLADTLLVVGTPAEALAQYQWLAGREPGRPEVRLGLARCRRQLGETAEARTLLDDLLAELPENGEAQWERGQVALDEGEAAQAEPWLRRAVRLLPHDRRVHYALYRCLLELDRRAEAETVNARVAEIDADLRQLARIRQEVMKRPDDVGLRCEGGRLFLRNGERGEGVRWLQRALRLDPGCETARRALAEVDAPSVPAEQEKRKR